MTSFFISMTELNLQTAEDIKQDYDTGKDGTVMVMFKVGYEKIEDLGNAVNSACSRKIELFL
jgi:hypothetical protein